MPQSSYQEPIEKEDLDLKGKFKEEIPSAAQKTKKKSEIPAEEQSVSQEVPEIPVVEAELPKERKESEESGKIETARKSIQTQGPVAGAVVQGDAHKVAQISEYEKKIEKLVELALQKGPDHAISVARHMDSSDNYTLDELHDRMLEEDLRNQLIAKGLLKEL